MPAAVERCVNSMLSKWKSDPSKRPAPKEEGQSAKDQAWAICSAAHSRAVKNSLSQMLDLDEGGNGPTLVGAAATNRPYIPRLKPTKVIEEGEEKKFLVHLANPGYFNHPSGPFVLNRVVFLNMIDNFGRQIIGQDAAYDCRHKPNDGAYGWFEALMFGDEVGEDEREFWGKVKPTKVGLERIEGGEFRYSSMEFHRNYLREDVVLDLENATEDFCVVDLEEDNMEDKNMGDNETVSLEELKKAQDELGRVKAEKEEAEKRAKEATEMALKLQNDAIAAEITAIVTLAQTHKDANGNSLPRQFIEWVGKFLSLENIGAEKDVVQLEGGVDIPLEVRRYIMGSVRNLVLEMPGVVPAERHSQGGSSEPKDDEDDFDYTGLWDEKK